MSATNTAVLEQERPLAVSISRAASLVGVSRWTIRNYTKLGKLRAGRLGRRVIIPMASLEKFVRDATRS